MTTSPPAAQRSARRTLVLIVAVFALPLVFAWVLTKGSNDWQPTKTVNIGVLLNPSLDLASHGVLNATGGALPGAADRGDWFVVVMHTSACSEPCRRWVGIAEQVRIAVARDAPRVTVVMLGPDRQVPASGRQHWRLPAAGNLVDALAHATRAAPLDVALLIVNHQGRAVLTYPADEAGPCVLKDLKRLLRATALP